MQMIEMDLISALTPFLLRFQQIPQPEGGEAV